MLILGINTSGGNGEIALVSEQGVLLEKSWISDNNESELLLPNIQNLMLNAKLGFNDLDKVLVVNGPGPFTALRVSIAVANTIAYAQNIPVISVPIFKYLKGKSNVDFAIYAGRNQMWFQDKLCSFDKFYEKLINNKIDKLFGVIPSSQKQILIEKGINIIDSDNLKSFGNVILDLLGNKFEDYDQDFIAKPLYFAAPHITKSKKFYK